MSLNANIAYNLKKIRTAKGLSLDVVAEQTGVSKSMLGQIERGVANPSVSVIGKIVSGLRVELDELVKNPLEELLYIPKNQIQPTKELENKYRVYTYFPYDKDKAFEIYVIEIFPGASYLSGSHGEGTKEYLMVDTGSLKLRIEERCQMLESGDAIRFDTDKEHEYINVSEEMLRLTIVFAFK